MQNLSSRLGTALQESAGSLGDGQVPSGSRGGVLLTANHTIVSVNLFNRLYSMAEVILRN